MNSNKLELESSEQELKLLEKQFKNFIVLGDGINVQGDIKGGYAVSSTEPTT